MFCSRTKVWYSHYSLHSDLILDMCSHLSRSCLNVSAHEFPNANLMPFTLCIFPVVSVLAACAILITHQQTHPTLPRRFLYPLTNTIVFSFKNPRRQFRQSARYITTNLQLESMCALPVWLPAYWIWIYVCLNISICAWITLTGSEIRCQRDCQINHLYIYIYHIESFRRIDLAFRVPDNFEPHPYGIDMQWYGTHNRMQ